MRHVGDEEPARIVRIRDPVGKARTFTFDCGWIAIAGVSTAEAHARQGEGQAPPKGGAA